MEEEPSGIPRPYSSTDVATPRRVLQELFAPIELWVMTMALVFLSAISVTILTVVTKFTYSSNMLILSIGIAIVAMLIQSEDPKSLDVRSVPSIEDVSRTVEYFKLSSRITVISLASGLFAAFVLVGVHTFDSVVISDASRAAAVGSLALGYVFSYIIVRTLCSYTPLYENTRLSLPVDISSFPEIATALGFIVPPLAIFYAGFVYVQGGPIVTLPFAVTVIDAYALSLSVTTLYFSAVSRL